NEYRKARCVNSRDPTLGRIGTQRCVFVLLTCFILPTHSAQLVDHHCDQHASNRKLKCFKCGKETSGDLTDLRYHVHSCHLHGEYQCTAEGCYVISHTSQSALNHYVVYHGE